MAASKLYGPLWANPTPVPAATLQASPVVSGMIDVSTVYGGELVWRITNGGALGAPCVIMFQVSYNGTDWFDYQAAVSKDLLAGTVSQGTIPLTKGNMFVRAISYGNTTNSCSVLAGLQIVVSL